MDFKEYIESGKLESYVLGTCTKEDALEAECMARVFPEVKQELELLRSTLETFAISSSIAPPADLKSKIFAAIEEDEKDISISESSKVISMIPTKNQTNQRFTLLIAACVSILIISGFITYSLVQKNSSLSNEISNIQSQQQKVQQDLVELTQQYNTTQEQFTIINNPSTIKVALKGLPNSPKSVATVFWNKDSKEVFLAINSLPKAPEGKQYQLWAIKDGGTIDAGVFDLDDTLKIQKMKGIEDAQAFAVTLEKAGGVSKPEGTMFVLGNI